MKKKSLAILLVLLSFFAANAQEKNTITFGSDFVSSYVWRAVTFDRTPNIQPWATYSKGGFSLGYWGSYNLQGSYYETDFWASYTIGSVTLVAYDYHADFTKKYFDFDANTTAHTLETNLTYVGQKTPLHGIVSVLVWGADKKIASRDATTGEVSLGTDNNFSTYIELGYTFGKESELPIDLTVGGMLNESYFYGNDKAGIINISATFSRKIEISDKFSLPISLTIAANPSADRAIAGCKISL